MTAFRGNTGSLPWLRSSLNHWPRWCMEILNSVWSRLLVNPENWQASVPRVTGSYRLLSGWYEMSPERLVRSADTTSAENGPVTIYGLSASCHPLHPSDRAPPPFDQVVVKLLFHADGTGGQLQSTWLACVCVLSVINRHLEKSLAEWQRPTQVRDRSPHTPVLQQVNSCPSMMHIISGRF